jgi:hypothetical protein
MPDLSGKGNGAKDDLYQGRSVSQPERFHQLIEIRGLVNHGVYAKSPNGFVETGAGEEHRALDRWVFTSPSRDQLGASGNAVTEIVVAD